MVRHPVEMKVGAFLTAAIDFLSHFDNIHFFVRFECDRSRYCGHSEMGGLRDVSSPYD
jgi:hypothetical protein